MTRNIINFVLLFLALENLLFIIKYASFSQWQTSWLGRSIMLQKSILLIICLMFPVNDFLRGSDDKVWFKVVQICLFAGFIVAFAIDFSQLYDVQRSRMARTVARLRTFRKLRRTK